jgi:uncharacterized protein YukE
MGHVEVDPAELQDMSRRLAAITGELRGMGDRLRLGHAEAGAASVADALAGFADRWDRSLAKLAEVASTTAVDLRTAADGYTQVDAAVADGFAIDGGDGGTDGTH